MDLFKKHHYKVNLGEFSTEVKCPFPIDGLEFDSYLLSPKIKISYSPSSFSFNMPDNYKDRICSIAATFGEDNANIYVTDLLGKEMALTKEESIAVIHKVADRLKFDFYKQKRKLIKKANPLLKSWQKDSLITAETSNILAITL